MAYASKWKAAAFIDAATTSYFRPLLTVVALVLVAFFCVAGCASDRISIGLPAQYKNKLRTLSLTEQQARERLVRFLQAEHGTNPNDGFHADHVVIEGDSFIFSIPHPNDLSLVNYAVDGHTRMSS